MHWKRKVRERLAGLDLEPWRAEEIADELAQDLEQRYREALAAGATPREAETELLGQLASIVARRRIRISSTGPRATTCSRRSPDTTVAASR